jgi:hypothetical protein
MNPPKLFQLDALPPFLCISFRGARAVTAADYFQLYVLTSRKQLRKLSPSELPSEYRYLGVSRRRPEKLPDKAPEKRRLLKLP